MARQAAEVLRRNTDRDERLRAAETRSAELAAEAKRLEQQRAQLEAELAEAHRERCPPPSFKQPPSRLHLDISAYVLESQYAANLALRADWRGCSGVVLVKLT